MGLLTNGVSFATLRAANIQRLPQFRDKQGRLCHPHPTGADWSVSEWLEAVMGELGEFANLHKKVRRGDLSMEDAKLELGRELADVAIYLDILALQLDVDLGAAIREKFNVVSRRVGAAVFIGTDDWHQFDPDLPRTDQIARGAGEAVGQYCASLDDMQAWARGLMASRIPDYIINPGEPDYIRRWWVLPRNDLSNVYLHLTQRDDEDRALHDHPWPSRSVIIEGGYIEVTPDGAFERGPGDVIERSAEAAHRLVLRRDDAGNAIPCISLFFTGPKERDWGFHCPNGWVPWRDFVDDADTGKVGRGCGE